MSDPEVAREWLTRAQDLHAARLLHDGGLPALAAFHAQQAAEKGLKAIVIARGSGIERTHDVERLARSRRGEGR